MNLDTAQYIYILQQVFGTKDVKIEVVESTTEWNTTFYLYCFYIKSVLMDELPTDRLREFIKDGAAAVLDANSIFDGTNLDEVVDRAFWELRESQSEKFL